MTLPILFRPSFQFRRYPADCRIRAGARQPAEQHFRSVLTDAIVEVESFQQTTPTPRRPIPSGEGEELHHVAIATQQAELSFQLFMQVRNKVITAYQQVMQMQV